MVVSCLIVLWTCGRPSDNSHQCFTFSPGLVAIEEAFGLSGHEEEEEEREEEEQEEREDTEQGRDQNMSITRATQPRKSIPDSPLITFTPKMSRTAARVEENVEAQENEEPNKSSGERFAAEKAPSSSSGTKYTAPLFNESEDPFKTRSKLQHSPAH